ncbi:MAG: EpsG family protein [Clostridiales bacterium]|nr:EpsG family protein [Clostridiales bacterium]
MSSLGSLALYLIIFLSSFSILSIGNMRKKSSRIIIIVGLLIPILFASLRYAVGTDYFNYMRSYNSVQSISFREYFNNYYLFEIGHFLIRKISLFLGNYGFMLAAYASITVVSIYYAIKQHYKNSLVGISFMLFLCIYYPLSLNLMPQFAAISIVLLSFKYIFMGNFKKYFITILIASSFHITALVALPLFFLWDKEKDGFTSKWKVVFSILTCLFIVINYQLLIDRVSEIGMFSDYGVYAIENVKGQNRDLIVKAVILFVFLVLRKPLIRIDTRNKLYILLIIFSVIIGITGYTSPFVKRVALYFEITQIFLIPSIIKVFTKTDRLLLKSIVILYAVSYFYLVYFILGQAFVIPYNTYLF